MDRLLPKTITNNSPKAQKSGGQSRICCQRVEDNAFHPAKTAEVQSHCLQELLSRTSYAVSFCVVLFRLETNSVCTSDRGLPTRSNVDQRTSAISSFRLYPEPKGCHLASAFAYEFSETALLAKQKVATSREAWRLILLGRHLRTAAVGVNGPAGRSVS